MSENNIKSMQYQVVEDSLSAMETIADEATNSLNNSSDAGVSSLAAVNTFTDQSSQSTLKQVNFDNRRLFENLSREPYLCRVSYIDDENKKHTVFITRFGSIRAGEYKLANRNGHVGRLASLEPGESHVFIRNGKERELIVVEKLQVAAERSGDRWDSERNRYSLESFGVERIGSLRAFLDLRDKTPDIFSDSELDLTDAYRSQYLSQFALQDQPILDKFQDEIFRLPINSQYFLSGPPGTGKTTTLIRRLAQKLDLSVTEENNDMEAISKSRTGVSGLKNNWVMFSPTSLLRHWVKEAFGKEDIPATDERILVWKDYRRSLARGTLRILGSVSNTGFILRENSVDHLLPDTNLKNQIDWFEDFQSYQSESFLSRVKQNAKWLSTQEQIDLQKIGKQCLLEIQSDKTVSLGAVLVRIEQMRSDIEEAYSARSKEINQKLESHIRFLHNNDKELITRLREELKNIEIQIRNSNLPDTEPDDEDLDEDDQETKDEAPQSSKPRSPGIILRSAMTSLVNAKIKKSTIKKNTMNALVVEWLGDEHIPSDALIGEVGKLMNERKRLATFRNVFTKYLRNARTLYRSFRKKRAADGQWYSKLPASGRDLSPAEVDLIILALLMSASDIIAAAPKNVIEGVQETSLIAAIVGDMKSQILIDEATDFSPLQLSIMYHLSDPSMRSVFLSGDFNQRLTSEGVKSFEQMSWAIPGVNERPISVSYRQSKTLMELGQRIIELDGGDPPKIMQPKGLDIQSVQPVLGEELGTPELKAFWLSDRIIEINQIVPNEVFPSIAILVNDDEIGVKLAKLLSQELEAINLKAVACLGGEALGSGNDIRIYNRRYIKGLEFEAVFFMDLDTLFEEYGDLAIKYLYVGSSRARTFFGIATKNSVPAQLEPLRTYLTERWK